MYHRFFNTFLAAKNKRFNIKKQHYAALMFRHLALLLAAFFSCFSIYPPPRLARTAFLIFRRQAPLYHLLTYTLVPPYTVLCTLLRDLKICYRLGAPLPPDLQKSIFSLPGPLKINIFASWTSKNQYFRSPDL